MAVSHRAARPRAASAAASSPSSPGNFGIAVVSPPLDDAGNSVRAQKAIRDILEALHGNPYTSRTEKGGTTRMIPDLNLAATSLPRDVRVTREDRA